MIRFWSKVDIKGPDECWNWKASFKSGGKNGHYGSFRVGKRCIRAHRVAYELTYGSIPEGEGPHGVCVCHRCDNPSCCNPSHLFLGSQHDNIRDTESKKRGNHPKGESVGNSRMLDSEVIEMRRLRLEEGMKYKDLAALFRCSLSQVYSVLSGKTRRSAK